MRSWFRLKRNKLYRRFNFDPHNFILKTIKLDKSFKNIVAIKKKKYGLKKSIYKKNLIKKKIKYLRNLKKYHYIKKFSIRAHKRSWNIKNLKKKWYTNFWAKIKTNYFIKKHRILKKKTKFKSYRDRRKNKAIKNSRRTYIKKIKLKLRLKKRSRNVAGVNLYKDRVRKRLSQKVWLFVKKSYKKKKTWWLLRITLRKVTMYYGFKSLKKFRLINKFVGSPVSKKYYQSNKPESMANILLLRINVFDNIFVSNNFIKYSNLFLVDFKNIYNPYQIIEINQIISFLNVKKIQYIFKKRIMFSKYFFVKNYKNKNRNLYNRKIIKIINNVPLHIHYDYQIMCFCIYRSPNKKEMLSNKKGINEFWAIDTRLQYN